MKAWLRKNLRQALLRKQVRGVEMGVLGQVACQHVPRLLGTGRRREVRLEQPQEDSPSQKQQKA